MKNLNTWNSKSDPHFKNRNVFAFDLDDTLTTHTQIFSETLGALEDLGKIGKKTVLVTGRSAGWADALIKLFPLDGVVAENGGLILYWKHGRARRDPREEPVKIFYSSPGKYKNKKDPKFLVSPDTHDGVKKVLKATLKKFPTVKVSSDQDFRLFDLAIDFAEEVDPPLSFTDADQIRKIFEKFGAVAKVSSIHVNGWWGDFSKSGGLEYLCQKVWGLSLKNNVVYTGDSPNDAPLFEAAGVSVGVANIESFLGKVDFVLPQYKTQNEQGRGVVELVKHFLAITKKKL